MRKLLGKVVCIYAEDWTGLDKVYFYHEKIKEKDVKPAHGELYGLVIFENKDFITITQQVFDVNQARDNLSIPRRSIDKITIYKPIESRK